LELLDIVIGMELHLQIHQPNQNMGMMEFIFWIIQLRGQVTRCDVVALGIVGLLLVLFARLCFMPPRIRPTTLAFAAVQGRVNHLINKSINALRGRKKIKRNTERKKKKNKDTGKLMNKFMRNMEEK